MSGRLGAKVILGNVNMRKSKELLTMTPKALEQLKAIFRNEGNEAAIGVRLGLKKQGCGGFAYTMEVVQKEVPTDEKVTIDEKTKLFIDSKALLNVIGTQMDYVEDKLFSQFVFTNPNAVSSCGCGESFSVDTKPL